MIYVKKKFIKLYIGLLLKQSVYLGKFVRFDF